MVIPVQVKLGVALLFFSIAAEAALILADISLNSIWGWLRRGQILNFIVPFAPVALRLFLLAMIWNGKTWARNIFALFTLIGVASMPFLPPATHGYWLIVMSLLCQVAGIVLLFLQPAAGWFKRFAPISD